MKGIVVMGNGEREIDREPRKLDFDLWKCTTAASALCIEMHSAGDSHTDANSICEIHIAAKVVFLISHSLNVHFCQVPNFHFFPPPLCLSPS